MLILQTHKKMAIIWGILLNTQDYRNTSKMQEIFKLLTREIIVRLRETVTY